MRIKLQLKLPNPLFESWIEELYFESIAENSDRQHSLKLALESLRLFPLQLHSGMECAVLKGFNRKLCQILDRKLMRHQRLFDSLPHLANASKEVTKHRSPLIEPEIVDLSCSPPSIHKNVSHIQQYKSPSKKIDRLKKRAAENNIKIPNSRKELLTPKKLKIDDTRENALQKPKCCSMDSSCSAELPEVNLNDMNVLKNCDNLLDNSNLASTSKSPVKRKKKLSRKTSESNLTKKLSPKKKGRSYVPGYRSGGYALLLTLLKHSQMSDYKGYMTTSELQSEAQPLSKESFTKPKPHTFYTAWSVMKTLINKDLVNKQKKVPARFSLTESGEKLATQLLQMSQDENDDLNSDSQSLENQNTLNDSDGDASPVVIVDPKDRIMVKSKSSDDLDEEVTDVNNLQEAIKFTPYSFEVILLVDKMETTGAGRNDDMTVKELNKYDKMMKYELRHLKVGDFTWVARNVATQQELILPYIVERKRIDDLAKSIKDGRYNEQKFRLKQSGIPNVIYLIESYGSNRDTAGLPMSSLMQAAANTRVQETFMPHFTTSLSDSMKFLAMMTKNLADGFMSNTLVSCNKEKFSTSSLTDDPVPLMVFDTFNAMAAKSKTLTVKDMFVKQLLQLSGLSVEKAMAITSVYPTPQRLVKEFEVTQSKPELLLTKIKYGNLYRNISPAISKSIYQYFTNVTLL